MMEFGMVNRCRGAMESDCLGSNPDSAGDVTTVFTVPTLGTGATNSISLMGKLKGLKCLNCVWHMIRAEKS